VLCLPVSVNRYNILREANEGYAKLITLLGSGVLRPAGLPAFMTELKALIGTFELDPNRVVDLVLDAWEQQPNNTTWLKVLEPLHKDAPVHVS
jgi:THO complex subunit 2